MESKGQRLQSWLPNYVIESTRNHALMMDPEIPDFYRSEESQIFLIAVRNLTRRVLEKCCTMKDQTKDGR